ncbi:MAG: hypothetical protein IPM08_17020 [Actinomycetales bacterium]|nr:hypothetical protein [Actinomycetales bacterium]
MAIVFVHGVATRDEDDPQFPAVERFAREANWPVVEAMLRQHVAPVLRPADPAGVAIVRVYWGDLGMRPRVPLEADLAPGVAQDDGAGLGADDTAYPLPVDLEDVPNLAALTPAELGRRCSASCSRRCRHRSGRRSCVRCGTWWARVRCGRSWPRGRRDGSGRSSTTWCASG